MSDQPRSRLVPPLPDHPDVLRSLFQEADRYVSNLKEGLHRLRPHLVGEDHPRVNPLLAALDPGYVRGLERWRRAHFDQRTVSLARLKWDAPDILLPPRLKP